MEKKKVVKNEVVEKPVKEEKEISDNDLDKASGGVQAVRSDPLKRKYNGSTSEEGHWWTAASED